MTLVVSYYCEYSGQDDLNITVVGKCSITRVNEEKL